MRVAARILPPGPCRAQGVRLSGLVRGIACGIAALAPWLALSSAGAKSDCQLPSPLDSAKPSALYQVVTGPSWVRFDAKAFLHNFGGQTSRIQGTIRVADPDRLAEAQACILIDAASLDTGNSTRDDIMRNEHLETSKFPTIDFLLQTVRAVTHRGENWEFTAEGTLSLHGVSRDTQFPVRAHREGDVIRLWGQLPGKMTDYHITIPRFLMFTVEDQVQVSFDVSARPAQR